MGRMPQEPESRSTKKGVFSIYWIPHDPLPGEIFQEIVFVGFSFCFKSSGNVYPLQEGLQFCFESHMQNDELWTCMNKPVHLYSNCSFKYIYFIILHLCL